MDEADQKSSVDSDNDQLSPKVEVKLPQKRFYRQRAHSNPMSDHVFD